MATSNSVEYVGGMIREVGMRIGQELKYLGTGSSKSEMGAIEFLAKEINDGANSIAAAISELADAINNHK